MSQHGCPERLSNRSKGFQEDGPSQPTMEVLVETLTGTAFEMTVSPSDTIFAIKSKIFRVEGIPISQQHLLYNLKELDDSSSLREYSISDGARLRLVLGMRGGPISTRRLPPPARDHTEPWPDIERLLDSNREEGEWSGGSGCKVTVLVFRDGERVNMLRVRENHDGTYSPLDTNKYTSSLSQLVEQSRACGAGALQENAVTHGKMQELRRRMETLSLHRHPDACRTLQGEKPEIKNTRIGKTLSVPSLLDDSEPFKRNYSHSYESADTFAPLYDGNYTRYDYDCTFTDRFSLPPLISPIGTRSSNNEADDDLKLSDLAGSILVKREEGAILEECGDSDECRLRERAAKNMASIPAAEFGPLVGGVSWSPAPAAPLAPVPALSPPAAPAPPARAPRAPHSHSASSLQLRAPPPAPHHPPLSDALFSSSTSELEKLKRNSSRILPALSRHRNRSHLHLSDEGLHLASPDRADRSDRADLGNRLSHANDRLRCSGYLSSSVEKAGVGAGVGAGGGAGAGGGKKRVRCALCCKRLSIATVHTCRCGARYCAPHRYAEVHGCAYDYKAHAHLQLQRVAAPKLPEI